MTENQRWTFHLCLERDEETVLDTELSARGPAEAERALGTLHRLLDWFGPEKAENDGAQEAGTAYDQEDTSGAKGLLILRCPECDSLFTTFLAERKETFRCKCGGKIDLTASLKPFRYRCECCGKSRSGLTNAETPALDVRCGCGNPIALTWVPNLRMYRD